MQVGRLSIISVYLILACLLMICLSCEKSTPFHKTGSNNSSSEQEGYSQHTNTFESDANDPNWIHPRSDERIEERKQMVKVLQQRYQMKDPNILQVMLDVPRHWFVPESGQRSAYYDGPQSIGYDQTISQPFIVAYMTQLLELKPESKVLEIGTGSGYQAAVLSELTPKIYTIEIIEPLGQRAIETFKQYGYHTIQAKIGDGYKGWPEYAPFDAIIVTCAPDHIPQPLLDQLKVGGRIVIPVGERWQIQELYLVTKTDEGVFDQRPMIPVQFVPLLRD